MTKEFQLIQHSLGPALRFLEARDTHRAAGQALGEVFRRALDELLDLPRSETEAR